MVFWLCNNYFGYALDRDFNSDGNGDRDNNSVDNRGGDNNSVDNRGGDNNSVNNRGGDNNSVDNGAFNNISVDNGAFDNGAFDNGAFDNGAFDNGAFDNISHDNQDQDNFGENQDRDNSGIIPNEDDSGIIPNQDNTIVDDENFRDLNVEETVQDNSDSNSEGKWLSYSELMLDSYPAKSKIIYLKAYKMFERYLKGQNQFVPNVAPTELQILNFFHYLKHEKNFAPTTLWSTYSRVNACVKRLFGFSLKSFVRVTDVLKSYESGYKVKKASVFTPQEVLYHLKQLFISEVIFGYCFGCNKLVR